MPELCVCSCVCVCLFMSVYVCEYVYLVAYWTWCTYIWWTYACLVSRHRLRLCVLGVACGWLICDMSMILRPHWPAVIDKLRHPISGLLQLGKFECEGQGSDSWVGAGFRGKKLNSDESGLG